MRKKRLCAWLLSLTLLFSLLPVSAAAAEDTGAVPKTNTKENMTLTKTVTPKDDGTYTVRLESYATGEVTTTTTTKPLDIVLLLDVSGSMDETFTPAASEYTAVYSEELDISKTYYIRSSGRYVGVAYCSDCVGWTRNCWDGPISGSHYSGDKYTPKTGVEDADKTHTQFYEYSYTPKQSKLDALKAAVNNFIDDVAKNSPSSNISVVKFADNSNNSVGNDFTRQGYNYTQIVQELTNVGGTGVEKLKAAVSSLEAAGATASD